MMYTKKSNQQGGAKTPTLRAKQKISLMFDQRKVENILIFFGKRGSDMKLKKKAKRRVKVLFIILVCVLGCSLGTFFIDASLAEQGDRPIFSIPYAHVNDGGSTGYLGLGYQIITWRKIQEDNSYLVGVEKHYMMGIDIDFSGPKIPLGKQEG